MSNPHLARVLSFATHYARLQGPVFRRNRRRVARIIAADFVGASSVGAMIACIAFYVNAIQAETPVTIPLLSFRVEEGIGSLLIIGGLVVLLNALGAVATYDASVRTRAIGRDAYTIFSARVVSAFQGALKTPTAALEYNPAVVSRQIMRNALQMGIAAETIIRCCRPSIYCLVAFGILVHIDVYMTLLLAPAGLVVGPLIYLIGSRVTSNAREFFDARVSDYGAEVSQIIETIDASSLPPVRGRGEEQRFASIGAIRKYLDAYDRFLLADVQMTLAISLCQAAVFGFAITVFGMFAMEKALPWGSLLAYVTALVYLLAHLKSLLSSLTTLNRFYPNAMQFYLFLEDCKQWRRSAEIEGDGPAVKRLSVTVEVPELDESERELSFSPGTVVLLHSPVSLSRLQFDRIAEPLSAAIRPAPNFYRGADFVQSRRRPENASLLENLCDLSQPQAHERLERAFDALGLGSELAALPKGLNTSLTRAGWPELSADLRGAVLLVPCLFSERPYLFIDQAVLGWWPPERQKTFLDMLSDKLVFLVTNGADETLGDHAELVIVLDEGGVLGLGDLGWYIGQRTALRARASSAKEERTETDEITLLTG